MSTRGWPAAVLTPTTKIERAHGSGDEAIEFIETFCRVTKDSIGGSVGEHIILRPWQKQLIRALLARRADGRYKHRQALIGMARKNAKSTLLSGLALWNLVTGPGGGEVYAVASGKEQARIVFSGVKRMVEMDPDLSDLLTLYRDSIEMPSTGSTFKVMAAEAPALEGLNPSFVIYDEVHTAVNRELWDVLALASGARPEPLMVGITTAGVRTDNFGRDRLAYSMYGYGRRIVSKEQVDDSFFMAWWEPKNLSTVDVSSLKAAKDANPGLDDLVSVEEFEASRLRTPEAEFKTKRLNMWVESNNPWLPSGVWDARRKNMGKVDLTGWVVLAFDGSYKNDSTVVIGCTVDTERPYLFPIGLWEKDSSYDLDWRVPIQDVEDAIREACRDYTVVEVTADPYRWSRSIQVLQDEGINVTEFPQSPARMVPATQRFYDAVLNYQLQQSGDPAVARHVGNATVKVDSRGARLAKAQAGKKIDAAVASVMALERAQWYKHQPETQSRKVYGFGA